MPTVRNLGSLLAAATMVGVAAAATHCWAATATASPTHARATDARAADARTADARTADARTADARAADARTADRGAASSNWVIMEWTDPLTVSVDTASIEMHAALVMARVLWDYTVARTSEGPVAAQYRSMVGTLVFDCATGRLGAAGGIDYSDSGGDGETVAQYAIAPELAPLSPTHRGTIGNDLVEYVCEHASRRLAKYDSGGLAWLGLRSSRQAASTVRAWRGIRTRYTISRTPAIVLKASTSVSNRL